MYMPLTILAYIIIFVMACSNGILTYIFCSSPIKSNSGCGTIFSMVSCSKYDGSMRVSVGVVIMGVTVIGLVGVSTYVEGIFSRSVAWAISTFCF